MKIFLNKECLSSDHEGQKILLNIDTGRYLEINNTGAAILDCIDDGIDTNELIDLISKKYSIEAHEIENDIHEFIEKAANLKAIHIVK